MIAVEKVVSRSPYSGQLRAHQFQRLRQSSLQVWTSAHLAVSRQSCRFKVTYEHRYLFLSASGLTRCCHVTARISNDLQSVAWLSCESADRGFYDVAWRRVVPDRAIEDVCTRLFTQYDMHHCFHWYHATSEGRWFICLVLATTASRQAVNRKAATRQDSLLLSFYFCFVGLSARNFSSSTRVCRELAEVDLFPS